MNSDLFAVCHFIFCGFVEPPKKELQLLLHFLIVQSGQRGVEREAVGKKKRIYTKDSLKMFPFYASTGIPRYW